MKAASGWILLPLLVVACAPRPDPRVEAAQDFQTSVFQTIEQDEAQMRRINGLRLGMSNAEVLNTVGPPSKRESHSFDDGNREIWTYGGAFRNLGILTFENQKLVQIRVD
jgi:hypothetical protein